MGGRFGGECAAAALCAQSCLTLCDPKDCNPPGSSVHGLSQARVLEWVAMPFSRGSSQPGMKPKSPALAGRFFTAEPPGKPLAGEWILVCVWLSPFAVHLELPQHW